MSTPTDSGSSVSIQISSASVPSTPSWFGEVVLIVKYLRKHGILAKISEEVRVACKCDSVGKQAASKTFASCAIRPKFSRHSSGELRSDALLSFCSDSRGHQLRRQHRDPCPAEYDCEREHIQGARGSDIFAFEERDQYGSDGLRIDVMRLTRDGVALCIG